MSDSEKCFTYLRDNIPAWVEELKRVGHKIEEKQDEIAKVPVTQKVVKKTGSTESLRPGKENVLDQETGEAEDHNPQNQIPNQAQRLTSRKRKTASVISKASGPTKYRTRSMIVVYYDSEVQKAFENLVRNIGQGRNMLRKGKMAARMEAMTAESPGAEDDDSEGSDPILAKLQFRPGAGMGGFRTTRSMGPGKPNGDGGPDAFDQADKALENAQSLCERGAHQSLREGDCRVELEGARKSFQDVMTLCAQEIEKQEEKAAKAAEKVRQWEPAEQARQSLISHSSIDTDAKLLPTPISGTMKIDHIEVDDCVSDDDEFVMPVLPPQGLRMTSQRC
ncbi:uncharacterized protein IWZ02DRAFT_189982 [Phyllosticta citriasiana]|uniref:Uncharacterized protein n=1 Tax=Phyllosticta citriasiana TaxID=595635 RepID=A0ABR1KBL3_9PEZI